MHDETQDTEGRVGLKNPLIDALNALLTVPDGSARWSVAQKLADQLGVTSILVGEANVQNSEIFWLSTDMDPNWMEQYLTEGYMDVDPALVQLSQSPGRMVMASGSLHKDKVQSLREWELNHALRDYGYGLLHCSRFGQAGAVGKFVTLCHDPSETDHVMCDLSRRDIFAALLANTIGPNTLPIPEQYHAPPRYVLTPRQRDVLSLLANGYQTARIAEKLGVTEATVTLHFIAARKALGANTREQALVIALQHGLISL